MAKKKSPEGFIIVPISLTSYYRKRLDLVAKHFKVNRSEMVRRMTAALDRLISENALATLPEAAQRVLEHGEPEQEESPKTE